MDILDPDQRAAGLLARHDVTSFPVPVASIVKAEGIQIGYDRHDGPEYGFALNDGGRRVIGVNTNTSAQRENCATAHCLGHMLLHEAVILVCRVTRASAPEGRSAASPQQEAEANAFCAALTMPEPWVAEVVGKMRGDGPGGATAFTEEIARRFGVSAEAAAFRLATLGLLAV